MADTQDAAATDNPFQPGTPAHDVFSLRQWVESEVAALRAHVNLPGASQAQADADAAVAETVAAEAAAQPAVSTDAAAEREAIAQRVAELLKGA